jgi:AsmA family protein
MDGLGALRRGLIWALAGFAALGVLLSLLIAALDAGYFKGRAVHFIAARAGRPVQIEGPLQMHLFSRHPELIAEGVTIGNPPWMPAGKAATIGKITVTLSVHGSARLVIDRVELQAAAFFLMRDARGLANWQHHNPDTGINTGPPLIRSLSIPGAHVVLDDDLRHVSFEGTVTAEERGGSEGLPSLHIEGTGQLNGRAATLELTGDPLLSASPDKPYRFTFAERSSGSHVSGSGFVPRPFDLRFYDIAFDATGADLKDLYYLTGVNLVDTGTYRLSGKLARRDNMSKFTDIAVSFGQSDIHGSASIETSHGHSTIDADMHSQVLRMADVGPRAAGRDSEPDTGRHLLFSTAMPNLSAARRNSGILNFKARRFEVGKVALQALAANIKLDRGLIDVASLSADLLGGKLNARAKIDARPQVPVAALDLKITDLELGELPRKGTGSPPVEGAMSLRVAVTGHGRSIHQVAATANGTITATLPQGIMRASLAELTGLDLRGMTLLFEKSKEEVQVRCGIANFQATDGTLSAQNFVIDTDPVLISGEGSVNLDSETLELQLQGHPKGVRILRLRAPLAIRGTLANPSFAIQTHDSKLVLVDRGRARNVDCSALLAASAHP